MVRNTLISLAVASSLLAAAPRTHAQSRLMKEYSLAAPITSSLPSNSISQMVISKGTIWIGTGKGLARSTDGGRHWESFKDSPEFVNTGIYALSLRGDTIWTSTGYTKEVEENSVQTGSGYTFSTNNAASWSHLPQTLDALNDSVVIYGNNRVRFLPIVVPEQNVTFDISLSSGKVWIASWSSGLRRSTNRGQSWERVVLPSSALSSIRPTDSLGYYQIDPREDNNFLAFSVLAESDSIIWAGTAGGINRSTDGGVSWTKFTRSSQVAPILADWVIAIAAQRSGGATRIWTTNWPAEGANQTYGVSYSDDGGRSWSNHLQGTKAYGFAFRDSLAYVATDDGIYRTADGGVRWDRSGTITGTAPGTRLQSPSFFAVAVLGDTVFAGSSEGLLKTVDDGREPFGRTWEVLRSSVPLPSPNDTYAYPNPFTPRTEATRIHYKTAAAGGTVSVEVFDFGMNRVRTVIRDASRQAATEMDEIWDGKNDNGDVVSNGVYFFRVSRDGEEAVWGKVMVLQ